MASADTGPSYYAVLNVPNTASEEDIRTAYKSYVSTYHPDKHQNNPELQAIPTSNFALLHEAYEVLSNPVKRQIYDIYGKEGLTAGLEVGTKVGKVDELKRKWAEFKAQEAGHKRAEGLDYKGVYIFRFNAENLIRPYDSNLSWVPEITGREFTAASISPTMQIALPARTTGIVGGRLDVVRGQGRAQDTMMGQASLALGLRHAASHLHLIEASANIGLQSLLSLQSSYQLTQHQSAALALTYQPGAGPGLQITSARQLSKRSKGEATVSLGPQQSRGVAVSVRTKYKHCQTVASLEVGAQTQLLTRVAYKHNKRATLHATARSGFSGATFELGGQYKWSDMTSTGFAMGVGSQGVVYRVSLTTGDHRVEVPVVLSSELDPKVIFWAGIAPPVLLYSFNKFLYGPLRRRHKLKQALEKARENNAELQEAFRRACDSKILMAPVASRKFNQELQKEKENKQGGLVIIRARYGSHAAIKKAEAEARQQRHSQELSDSQRQRSNLEESDALLEELNPASEEQYASDEESVDEEDREVQLAADAMMAAELPPPCLDVTVALRFMVEAEKIRDEGMREVKLTGNSIITFHKGIAKSGLMGFCDCVPGHPKELKVLFMHKNQPRVVTLTEKEAGVLPTTGQVVTDEDLLHDMRMDLEEQQQ